MALFAGIELVNSTDFSVLTAYSADIKVIAHLCWVHIGVIIFCYAAQLSLFYLHSFMLFNNGAFFTFTRQGKLISILLLYEHLRSSQIKSQMLLL